MKVLYPVDYDPKPLFADMEADNRIEYIPIDKHGNVMVAFSMEAGETLYIAGEKALKERV